VVRVVVECKDGLLGRNGGARFGDVGDVRLDSAALGRWSAVRRWVWVRGEGVWGCGARQWAGVVSECLAAVGNAWGGGWRRRAV
jgi:hypothetical protein